MEGNLTFNIFQLGTRGRSFIGSCQLTVESRKIRKRQDQAPAGCLSWRLATNDQGLYTKLI